MPRSHKIVGGMRLLHDEPSYGYASGWNLGDQLARQRRWDRGVVEDPAAAWKADYTGEAVNEFLGRPAAPRPEVTQLTIREIDSLDCAQLVQRFPEVTELYLHGRLGTLGPASKAPATRLSQEWIPSATGSADWDHQGDFPDRGFRTLLSQVVSASNNVYVCGHRGAAIPKRPPKGLPPEELWRRLVQAYAAGDRGCPAVRGEAAREFVRLDIYRRPTAEGPLVDRRGPGGRAGDTHTWINEAGRAHGVAS